MKEITEILNNKHKKQDSVMRCEFSKAVPIKPSNVVVLEGKLQHSVFAINKKENSTLSIEYVNTSLRLILM